MGKKRNSKILVQVGCLIFSLFTVVAIINGVCIYRSSSRNYIDMLYQQTEDILLQAQDCLEEYDSMPWLIGYWHEHSAELDLPGDIADRSASVKQILLTHGYGNLQTVTPEQAEALTEKEQKLYAEACYLAVMPRLYDVKENFDLTGLTCVTMVTRETALPLFQALPEGELTPYGNFCALGEEWPFNASLHPAVDELYDKQEDRAYFEEVTSTVNGIEYLYGYVPVLIDGEIACHICVSRTMSELRQSIALNTRAIEWINASLLIVSAVLLLLLIDQSILHPLSFVQRNVREYRSSKESETVVRSLAQIGSTNEVGRLADDFSDMVVELDEYSTNMARLSAEKERIGTELALAADIQAHMLPSTFPAFPAYREFDIYATMDPAKEVGGDFYDFFLIDDDRLALVMADVSGKGVPAALFMMTARTILKTRAQSNPTLTPQELLTEANATLYENNRDGMFVTVWLGILKISTGELVYADAGHEKLLLYQNGAWRLLPKETIGPALAMWAPEDFVYMTEEYRYRDVTVRLSPGDAIFQYTDGVTEAMTADRELFGEERLLAAMNSAPSARPEELLPHVRAKIDEFVKGAPQFDDITMLGLQYRGKE